MSNSKWKVGRGVKCAEGVRYTVSCDDLFIVATVVAASDGGFIARESLWVNHPDAIQAVRNKRGNHGREDRG